MVCDAGTISLHQAWMDSGPDLYAMSFRSSYLMRVLCALLSSMGPFPGLEDGVVVVAIELAEVEVATGAEHAPSAHRGA